MTFFVMKIFLQKGKLTRKSSIAFIQDIPRTAKLSFIFFSISESFYLSIYLFVYLFLP